MPATESPSKPYKMNPFLNKNGRGVSPKRPILLLFSFLLFQPSSAKDIPTDPTTGILMAEDWELVVANCIQCHSPKQFLRQRGTRSTWQSVVDWMQKDQGLNWLNDPKTEEKIVTYLAKNYPPEKGKYRRAPIPATLLPKNPYKSQMRKDFEAKKAKGEIQK